MKPEVKVCGMTLPQQMRQIEGADYVGMIFHRPSPRYAGNIDPESLTDVTQKRVGVFVDSPIENILKTASAYSLSVIQLHGQEDCQTVETLKAHGYEVWKALSVCAKDDLLMAREYEDCVDRLLFDTKTLVAGGSGEKFDWRILEEYDCRVPFMLAGGLAPSDVEVLKALKHRRIAGFDINSRFETTPGVKDIALVNSFIHSIKTNEPN